MTRALLLCLKIAIVVAVAIWLAHQPGEVTIDWGNYRVENVPIGFLVLAAVILAAVAALLYRLWRAIYRAPRTIGEVVGGSRRQRGYRALSHGMIAVAAGDKAEAARWSRKADSLLEDPPLTLLLSAQAAQINGNESTAKRLFQDMLDNPETRFLGLRGLLSQALADKDDQLALTYVRRAHVLRPKTPWVLNNLFELSERTGDLEGAEAALKEAAKAKVIPADEATAKRSAIILQRALNAEAGGRNEEALSQARAALKLTSRNAGHLSGSQLAAAIAVARVAGKLGRDRDVRKTVEQAWSKSPHPDLAAAYVSQGGKSAPMDRFKQLQRLASLNEDHPDSHIMLARAALKAELWGEARRHLETAVKSGATAQVCSLMAELEESEKGNAAAAREWLGRALSAPPAAAWLCDNCGAAARSWTAKCGVCQTFNSLEWRQSPFESEAIAIEATPTSATPALEVKAEQKDAAPNKASAPADSAPVNSLLADPPEPQPKAHELGPTKTSDATVSGSSRPAS